MKLEISITKVVVSLVLLTFSTLLEAEEYYQLEKSWPLMANPIDINNYTDIAANNNYIYLLSKHSQIDKLNKNGDLLDRFAIENVCEAGEFKLFDIQTDDRNNIYVLVNCDGGFNHIIQYDSKGNLLSSRKLAYFTSTPFISRRPSGESAGTIDGPLGGVAAAFPEGTIQVADNDIYVKDMPNGYSFSSLSVNEEESYSGNGGGQFRIINLSNDKEFILESEPTPPAFGGDAFCIDGNLLYFIAAGREESAYLYKIDRHNMTVIDIFRTEKLTSLYGCSVYNNALNLFLKESIINGNAGSYVYKYDFTLNTLSLIGNTEDIPKDTFQSKSTGDIFQLNSGLEIFNSSHLLKLDIGKSHFLGGEFGVLDDFFINDNQIYTSDSHYNRIQVFDLSGKLLSKWVNEGGVGEEFTSAGDIYIHEGYIYISDKGKIKKFTFSGEPLKEYSAWSYYNYTNDKSIAVNDKIYYSAHEHLYTINDQGTRKEINIPPYNPNPDESSYGWGVGEEDQPATLNNITGFYGLAVDNDGGLLFSRTALIYKINSTGDVLEITNLADIAFNSGLSRAKQHDLLTSLDEYTIDENGDIYFIINKVLYKLSRENQTIEAIPNILFPKVVTGISALNDKLYVSSESNILVFNKKDRPNNSKAIIIAGGTSDSDPLWNEIQANANHAFFALASQGYTKEDIYYLNTNIDFDLDNNGSPDDIDASPSIESIEKAITDWALDSENVVIYMIGHGGDQTFKVNEYEILQAKQLNNWLNTLQSKIAGKVTVIYDACSSGTFLSVLGQHSYDRTVITSSSGNENASFNDAISFSALFWSQVLKGSSINNAFSLARNNISEAYQQHPLLDSNNNGVGNETIDFSNNTQQYIGNGITTNSTAPTIGRITHSEVPEGETTAVITAYGVEDNNGVASVWGIVTPPWVDISQSGLPIQNQPQFNLSKVSENQYQGQYKNFNQPGTYRIAIYAQDKDGNTSFPEIINIKVRNPLGNKAIIVAGFDGNKDTQSQTNYAYEVLKSQGFSPENIHYLSANEASANVIRKATPNSLKLEITEWANNNTADFVLYLVGNFKNAQYSINKDEKVAASVLDSWLDILQDNIKGTLTVIHEGDYSAHLITALTPQEGKERMVISSSSLSEASYLQGDGFISFSRYFWNQIRQGSTIAKAFIYAQAAMRPYQTAHLNDNGNKVSNEKTDRRLARQHKIGVGILLAADEPNIQSISPDETLQGGSTTTLWVQDIVSTAHITKVWAVISPPEFNPVLNQTPQQYQLDLVKTSDNRWQVTHDEFNQNAGIYQIHYYAIDVNNRVSQPRTSYVIQTTGPDAYEVDNDFATAKVIQTTNSDPQWHNFHNRNDVDYIRFEAEVSKGQYTIKVDATGSEADPMLGLYDGNQTPVHLAQDATGAGEEELLYFTPEVDGVYYLKVSPYQTNTSQWPQLTGYKVQVFPTNGELKVTISGIVTNEEGLPIQGATVKTSVSGHAKTNSSGYYILQEKAGEYDLIVEASGYYKKSKTLATEANDEQTHDFEMTVDTASNPVPPTATAPAIQSGQLPASTASGGDKNVVMHILKVSIPEGGADLQSIKVKASGSGNEVDDIKRVTLYYDINRDGLIDLGDELLVEGQYGQDNGVLNLGLPAKKHFDAGNIQLMVGYDF